MIAHESLLLKIHKLAANETHAECPTHRVTTNSQKTHHFLPSQCLMTCHTRQVARASLLGFGAMHEVVRDENGVRQPIFGRVQLYGGPELLQLR